MLSLSVPLSPYIFAGLSLLLLPLQRSLCLPPCLSSSFFILFSVFVFVKFLLILTQSLSLSDPLPLSFYFSISTSATRRLYIFLHIDISLLPLTILLHVSLSRSLSQLVTFCYDLTRYYLSYYSDFYMMI